MDILEFKNMFKAAKRTASNFDEFCDELELYLEAAKKSAVETKTITIEISDSENQLIKMLEDIKESAGVGHSFSVIVDPDEDGGRTYGMDGDGSFKISDIKITEDAEEEIEEKEASMKLGSFYENTEDDIEAIKNLHSKLIPIAKTLGFELRLENIKGTQVFIPLIIEEKEASVKKARKFVETPDYVVERIGNKVAQGYTSGREDDEIEEDMWISTSWGIDIKSWTDEEEKD